MESVSFQPLKDYEKEFLEKIAEDVASSIRAAQITRQTTSFLQPSKSADLGDVTEYGRIAGHAGRNDVYVVLRNTKRCWKKK